MGDRLTYVFLWFWGLDEPNKKFKCETCSKYFGTQYRLKVHRKEFGHKGNKGRPTK